MLLLTLIDIVHFIAKRVQFMLHQSILELRQPSRLPCLSMYNYHPALGHLYLFICTPSKEMKLCCRRRWREEEGYNVGKIR